MALTVAAPTTPLATGRDNAVRAHPLASVAFDWTIVLTSGWMLGGLFLDGWAHNTIPSLETFFTPWHGVLYSGFFASLAVLGWHIGRNRGRGLPFWDAIPAGYELSLIGGLLFVLSGFSDMLWHTVFGIEANVDALLSPTHLLLLFGGTLFITGPIRSAGLRGGATRWTTLMPRLLALTFVLASLSFFTQYANPWGGPWLAASYRPLTSQVIMAGGSGLPAFFLEQGLSVTGVLLQSALLAGTALLIVRPGVVPAGGFTIAMGLYVVLTVLMRQKYDAGMQVQLVVAAIGAGVLMDLLYMRLRESLSNVSVLRAFIAVVPALATAALVAAIGLSQGLWWTIHLWAGIVVLSAGVGWLIAFLGTQAGPELRVSRSSRAGT